MEFTQKYARVDDDFDDGRVILDEQVSYREFIDDSTEFDNQQPLKNFFRNIKRNLKEAALGQSLSFLN